MAKEVLIQAKNLKKSFGKRTILHDLNIKVEAGDVYGFLGPNGAGKTTTIRMLLGLIKHDSGEIYLDGHNIEKDFKAAIRNIGAIVENPTFYTYLSAYDNLSLMANLLPGLPKSRINEVLEMVGLQNRAKDKVKTYSLGMKQRLGIANALLGKPKLVILDEPTNGLDPQGMKEVREMIAQLALEHDISFFISSHLLNEIELMCNKVGILKGGEVLAEGNVKQLLSSKNEFVTIHTSDFDKAETSLKNISFVKNFEKVTEGLTVEIDKGSSFELIKFMINNEIPIKYAVPQNNTLEKFFFDVTEGGEIK